MSAFCESWFYRVNYLLDCLYVVDHSDGISDVFGEVYVHLKDVLGRLNQCGAVMKSLGNLTELLLGHGCQRTQRQVQLAVGV